MDVERARETIATQRPRRLRLGELLHELGARCDDPAAPADPTAPTAPADPANPACPAADPADPAALADGSGSRAPADAHGRPTVLTVGELVDLASEAGFGFLIGVLALIAIPFFGLSTPFGLAIALIGAQLMTGRARPWLPARARRRALSMSMLDRVAGLLERRTRWLARSTRRRWESLIMPRAIGLGVVVLALALALPLPIPGSNMVFLAPLLIYAIGLLERDGVWIAIAHACLLADLVLMAVFGGAVWMVLQRIGGWLS
ncbi:MAG TPA: exopolysaccharide biosynthesis protein [Kofleriaceae bacterium]|nr:exopolysaccharide biosynthesis protein [Kofleriaceae bacterium]